MNTHYDNETGDEISAMNDFFSGMSTVNWTDSNREYFELFSSYFTFHIKIVQEIIREAREILNPDNREHVKNLVAYIRGAEEWFADLNQKRKASASASK